MIYLTEEQIILFNSYVIQRYSPSEPIGVVQKEALNMIVENPKQYVFGQELFPGVIEKAANLYKNLVQKHAFMNGNKRTAYFSLLMFLDLNGYELNTTDDEAVNFTVAIAEESLEDIKIVEWLQRNIESNR